MPGPLSYGYLSYNGIFLQIVQVADWNQVSVFDKSNTDFLWLEVTLNVSCIYNPFATSYATVNGSPAQIDGSMPAYTNNAIKQALLTPRAQLVLGFPNQISGSMVTVPANGMVCDVNRGPIPVSCDVVQVSPKTFHVRYSIKFFFNDCISPQNLPYASPTSSLISNRYTSNVAIDSDFYTYYRSKGTAIFRADVLSNLRIAADLMRDRILPAIPIGYKRSDIQINPEDNTNVVHWECTDKEMPKSLGNTGNDGSGTYITWVDGTYRQETSLNPDGGNNKCANIATCTVNVTGGKLASEWVMTQVAFNVASSKIPILLFPAVGLNIGYLNQIAISQNLMENQITLTIIATLLPTNNGPLGTLSIAQGYGLTVDNSFKIDSGRNPSPPFDNGTRGSSAITAFAVALKESYDQAAECAIPQTASLGCYGNLSSGIYDGCKEVQVFYNPNILPYRPNNNNPSTSAGSPFGITTHERLMSSYDREEGNIIAPIAGNSSSGAEILTLVAPYSTKTVEWITERIGSPPTPPSPYPSQSNSNNFGMTLARSKIKAREVNQMPDGVNLVYSMSGIYEYILKNPVGAGDTIYFDIPNYLNYARGGKDSNNNPMQVNAFSPGGRSQIVAGEYDNTSLGGSATTDNGFT